MSDVVEDLEQHTLTYQGKVNPGTGTLMGVGTNKKIWQVLGAVFNPQENVTKVIVEEFQRPE